MTQTRVINIKTTEPPADEYVYIGRPSKWGNPFVIGRDGTRQDVIEKFRRWIATQPHLLDALDELQGKTLGCYCHPKPCHGDVLAEMADIGSDKLLAIPSIQMLCEVAGTYETSAGTLEAEAGLAYWMSAHQADLLKRRAPGAFRTVDRAIVLVSRP